jgi:hypothetical protein
VWAGCRLDRSLGGHGSRPKDERQKQSN